MYLLCQDCFSYVESLNLGYCISSTCSNCKKEIRLIQDGEICERCEFYEDDLLPSHRKAEEREDESAKSRNEKASSILEEFVTDVINKGNTRIKKIKVDENIHLPDEE